MRRKRSEVKPNCPVRDDIEAGVGKTDSKIYPRATGVLSSRFYNTSEQSSNDWNRIYLQNYSASILKCKPVQKVMFENVSKVIISSIVHSSYLQFLSSESKMKGTGPRISWNKTMQVRVAAQRGFWQNRFSLLPTSLPNRGRHLPNKKYPFTLKLQSPMLWKSEVLPFHHTVSVSC